VAATRDPCPWHCGGEVATDDVRRTTSHSVPMCQGYLDFIGQGRPPLYATLDVLDDSGELVSGMVIPDARKPKKTLT
jgi:hypothetical protein